MCITKMFCHMVHSLSYDNFIVQQQLGSSFVPFEVHLEKLPGTEIFGKGSAGSMENIYKNFIANLWKVLNLG